MESDSKKSEVEWETLLKRKDKLQKLWNSLTLDNKKEFKTVRVDQLNQHVISIYEDAPMRLLDPAFKRRLAHELSLIEVAKDKKFWKCFNCEDKEFYDLKTLKEHIHKAHWDFETLRAVIQESRPPRVEELADQELKIACNSGCFSLIKSLFEPDVFVEWLFAREETKSPREVKEAYLNMIQIHDLYKQKIESMESSNAKTDVLKGIDGIQKVEREILKSSKDHSYLIFLEPRVKSYFKTKLGMKLESVDYNTKSVTDLANWIEKTGDQSGVAADNADQSGDQSGVAADNADQSGDQSGVAADNADQSGVAADNAQADQRGVAADNADQSGVAADNADQRGVAADAEIAVADDYEAQADIAEVAASLTTYSDPFAFTDLLAHARSMFQNQRF